MANVCIQYVHCAVELLR